MDTVNSAPSAENTENKAPLHTERKLTARTPRGSYLAFKRFQDVFVSLIVLIVLFPVYLIIALVVFFDDPKGSPIFVQQRIGKNGKPFKFYKFRSMCVNAEDKLDDLLKDNEMEGPAFKMKDDPRITRVGGFLRETSLDELPQFLNVLKGDMSLVGPRPPLPREVEQYDDYQRQRLMVTPGITCYWQVQPHRNDLTFDEWMELDLKYINSCSFMTDWKIILKTIGAVFGRNGE